MGKLRREANLDDREREREREIRFPRNASVLNSRDYSFVTATCLSFFAFLRFKGGRRGEGEGRGRATPGSIIFVFNHSGARGLIRGINKEREKRMREERRRRGRASEREREREIWREREGGEGEKKEEYLAKAEARAFSSPSLFESTDHRQLRHAGGR